MRHAPALCLTGPGPHTPHVPRLLRRALGKLTSDHADSSVIGTDKIWDKPFPDRLWLREVPTAGRHTQCTPHTVHLPTPCTCPHRALAHTVHFRSVLSADSVHCACVSYRCLA